MTEQYYPFQFVTKEGTTHLTTTMTNAIERARNKILNGYSSCVILNVLCGGKFVKLGEYHKAVNDKPYKPTQEIPDPPRVVDAIPVLPRRRVK